VLIRSSGKTRAKVTLLIVKCLPRKRGSTRIGGYKSGKFALFPENSSLAEDFAGVQAVGRPHDGYGHVPVLLVGRVARGGAIGRDIGMVDNAGELGPGFLAVGGHRPEIDSGLAPLGVVMRSKRWVGR